MPKPTPIAIFVSAVCALSGSLVFAADTGDAPDSYGIASHGVVGGAAFIGRNAPDDNDPVGSALADADDAIDGSAGGTDDEDGVFGFPDLVANGKSWSVNVFVSNPGSTAANLVAWVDFNGDGMFAANEASSDVVPPGADNIKIKLRWRDLRGVTSDFSGATFARFRLSCDALGDDDATGEASAG